MQHDFEEISLCSLSKYHFQSPAESQPILDGAREILNHIISHVTENIQ